MLADRNCHKSVNYVLTVTDAIPVYLMPSTQRLRNHRTDPPAKRLSPQAITEAVREPASRRTPPRRRPSTLSSTNSTYDGLCYRAERVVELLGQSVPRVHFDEAWFAYAVLQPAVPNRYAMHDGRRRRADPTSSRPSPPTSCSPLSPKAR